MTDKPQVPEFLTEAEFEALEITETHRHVITDDWDETMLQLATPNSRLPVPRTKDFTRKMVVTAFNDAFELMGGIPRLAIWAHEHPTEFYKLYSRLLPSQSSSALGETNEMVIKHVIPRGPLDE